MLFSSNSLSQLRVNGILQKESDNGESILASCNGKSRIPSIVVLALSFDKSSELRNKL